MATTALRLVFDFQRQKQAFAIENERCSSSLPVVLYFDELSTPIDRSKGPVDKFDSDSVDDHHLGLALICLSLIVRFYFLIMLNGGVCPIGQECFHPLVSILTNPGFVPAGNRSEAGT